MNRLPPNYYGAAEYSTQFAIANMNFLKTIFGFQPKCSLCGRRIEEGMMPMERISEWYQAWVQNGWFQGKQLLLRCSHCGRTYCSDCLPRFWQALELPGSEARHCECGKREFELIPGRQKGSKI
jgi:hypothetical protein